MMEASSLPELPPRARRIHIGKVTVRAGQGTTSACAENTTRRITLLPRAWNYLRVRGEYPKTPAWHPPSRNYLRVRGEYPKTPAWHPPSRNYLRVRGEYPKTPAWHPPSRNYLRVRGEYPKTPAWHPPSRNYLRVRGEYSPAPHQSRGNWELPPRARRIRPSSRGIIINIGTTSACAENTPQGSTKPSMIRNYLRVRGEYAIPRRTSSWAVELPPRARRILVIPRAVSSPRGTTSACAENTG